MKKPILRWRVLVAAVALCMGGALPGAASAREIWHQGRNVHPKTPACSIEKAAANHAFMDWDTCMGGQLKAPSTSVNAAAYYWARRRRCAPKYQIFTKAKNSYQACEARMKAERR